MFEKHKPRPHHKFPTVSISADGIGILNKEASNLLDCAYVALVKDTKGVLRITPLEVPKGTVSIVRRYIPCQDGAPRVSLCEWVRTGCVKIGKLYACIWDDPNESLIVTQTEAKDFKKE